MNFLLNEGLIKKNQLKYKMRMSDRVLRDRDDVDHITSSKTILTILINDIMTINVFSIFRNTNKKTPKTHNELQNSLHSDC